ncbi:MAG TPA: glycosyltransferase family 4 protein [Burkholderiaceae bacterium]|nr:glycosyltransferase family 4 protein [Burkholderiaceae bacterium]
MSDPLRPLRVLTWHVHGNYLYYLSQIPHELHLVTLPEHPPGHAGRVGSLPWGTNVHEVPAEQVPASEFDCVLYQSRRDFDEDRLRYLSSAQRRLPAVYLEHDPPQEHPTQTRHWAADTVDVLVHVTPFNALMWDGGQTPARVIEHGVIVPEGVHYSGRLDRGIVVVNNLRRRGRRLGLDVFEFARERVPLTLVGMDSASLGGDGEVPNLELAATMAAYRFFFNPIRYTSLGLAVVEAMAIGMPIVGLATTELPTVIRNEVNGYVDTRPQRLVEVMDALIHDRETARRWGEAARATAQSRFSIARFVAEWDELLREVCRR